MQPLKVHQFTNIGIKFEDIREEESVELLLAKRPGHLLWISIIKRHYF